MKAKKIIKILFLTPLIILFVLFEIFVVCLYGIPLSFYFIPEDFFTQTNTADYTISEKGQNR